MTNVPERIREAWKEVYVLFDRSYLMEGSEDDWKQYWDSATGLVKKYGNDIPLLEILEATANALQHSVELRKNGGKMPSWGADEDYPYPKF